VVIIGRFVARCEATGQVESLCAKEPFLCSTSGIFGTCFQSVARVVH